MDSNYFHIKEISRFLNGALQGFVIEEAFTQEKDKFLFALSKDERILFLEFSIAKKTEYIVLRENFSKAKKNVALLFPELKGMKITDAGLFNDDRVIRLGLNKGIDILFSFVRGKHNCFIVKDGLILNSFKDRNELLQKRMEEVFPERLSHIDRNETKDTLTVKEYAKSKYARYGNLYLKEVLFRIGLQEDDDASGNEQLLDDEFSSLLKAFDFPKYLFYSRENDIKTALTELEHLKDYENREFDNINKLLEHQNRYRYREDKSKDVLGSKIERLRKEIANTEGNLNNLRATIKEFKLAEKHKIHGDLILANIGTIKEGDEFFEVEDPFTGSQVKIKLKKDLKPAENANHYFDKYKRQKNAISEIEKKVLSFEKEKERLMSELEELENVDDRKEIKKLEKEIIKESKPDETSRFRKFILNDKYEVWVGKDSKANDLLTTKYSAPHDLWFHVRGSSGSHTVLKIAGKKDDVNKDIIKKAAAISAYYSKARNASMVPVAYCEKKFVKKPKGAKAGSVIMMREKVVNVKPELPYDQ